MSRPKSAERLERARRILFAIRVPDYDGGGTVKYMSKGTTLNDNRCRIGSLPGESNIFQ